MAHLRRIVPAAIVLVLLALAVVIVVLVIFTGCCVPGDRYGG